MNKYDDIINLERPKSKYPKMSMDKRSAEFSPFDALDGYDDSITEASKIIDNKKELTEEEKELINNKLIILSENIKNKPLVKITYYDSLNSKYIEIINNIKKIDAYNRLIILSDNFKININDIIKID